MGIPDDCRSQMNRIPKEEELLRNKLGEEKGAISTSVNGVSVQIFIKTQRVVTFFPAVLPEEMSLPLSLATVSLLWQWGFLVREVVVMMVSWCFHQPLWGFQSISVPSFSILWSFSVCLTSSCFCMWIPSGWAPYFCGIPQWDAWTICLLQKGTKIIEWWNCLGWEGP